MLTTSSTYTLSFVARPFSYLFLFPYSGYVRLSLSWWNCRGWIYSWTLGGWIDEHMDGCFSRVVTSQTIRAVLTYVQKKLQSSGNKAAQAVLCCLSCFFWCLEKCIKFINKNAYIQVCAVVVFATLRCSSCLCFTLVDVIDAVDDGADIISIGGIAVLEVALFLAVAAYRAMSRAYLRR